MNELEEMCWRPSSTRALVIQGRFKDDLAQSIRMEASRLLEQAEEPITIYIKSRGGAISSLKILEDILIFKNQNGNKGRVITVADGSVNSAASYLVVMGHYAYARRKIRLIFHGVRYDQIHGFKTIIGEEAMFMAMQLDAENRRIAFKMAEVVIYRLLHRYNDYLKHLAGSQRQAPLLSRRLLNRFFGYIYRQLSSDAGRSLVDNSLVYAKIVPTLIGRFKVAIPAGGKTSFAVSQAKLFRKIILHRSKSKLKTDWAIDSNTTAEVTLDYLFLQEFLSHRHFNLMQYLLKLLGENLLSQNEMIKLQNTMPKSRLATEDYLEQSWSGTCTAFGILPQLCAVDYCSTKPP